MQVALNQMTGPNHDTSGLAAILTGLEYSGSLRNVAADIEKHRYWLTDMQHHKVGCPNCCHQHAPNARDA